jgi:1-acyl-sn-glycerol-3-phosphate acyltransferase
MSRALELGRVATKSGLSLATTLSLWGCLDVESLMVPEARHGDVLFKWVGRWARTLLSIAGVELLFDGRYLEEGRMHPGQDEAGLGRVFVMNHRSGIDIPVMMGHVEAHLVSRHDLASWPLVGRSARRLGTLFVDRSSLRSGATVLKTMTRTLSKGRGVAIFPEGTAYGGDEVRTFRPGAFNAALRTGAEIVPPSVTRPSPSTCAACSVCRASPPRSRWASRSCRAAAR